MEFCIRPRRGGKTFYLLKKFMEDPERSVIAAPTMERKRIYQRMLKEHYGYEIRDHQFVSVNSVEKLRGDRKTVLVDDLEAIIYGLFPGQEVSLITATGIIV